MPLSGAQAFSPNACSKKCSTSRSHHHVYPSPIERNPNINKVLVIGPNGNIGRHLIPALLASKYDWPVVEQQMDWYSWTAVCEKTGAMLGYRPQVDVMDLLRGTEATA